jgi:cbb3-type cytochrome oxidase maturation protein
MTIISMLLPLALLLATGFILGFIWAVRNGQWDDVDTPPQRILMDDLDSKIHPRG